MDETDRKRLLAGLIWWFAIAIVLTSCVVESW